MMAVSGRSTEFDRLGLELLYEPSLLVGSDGRIRDMNEPASALLGNALSLFDLSADPAAKLRAYLLQCSGSQRPVVGKLALTGSFGSRLFRCVGRAVGSEDGDEPAALLIRLSAGHTRSASPAGERLQPASADARRRPSARDTAGQRSERARLIEQYLAMAEALRIAEREKHELLAEIQRARVEEQERIAHDLHDQAGQELSAAIVELRRLGERTRGTTKHRLDAIADDLSRAARNLHRVVSGGRPRIVEDQGLDRALATVVAAYAADGDLHGSFSSSGLDDLALSPTVETVVYRVVQEALTNVLKHASARHLDVQVTVVDGRLTLTVGDDGCGFDCDQPAEETADARETGFGLRGMRRRLSGVGGTLTILGGPGRGTTIHAVIPLPDVRVV